MTLTTRLLAITLLLVLFIHPANAEWRVYSKNMEALIQEGAEVLSSASVPFFDDRYDIHTYLTLDGQLYRCTDTFAIKDMAFARAGTSTFHVCYKFKGSK
jgi:hypothetical protein